MDIEEYELKLARLNSQIKNIEYDLSDKFKDSPAVKNKYINLIRERDELIQEMEKEVVQE